MEIYDYCNSVNTELNQWRERLFNVISHIDHLPTGDKQRMYEEVNGLHIIMAELEERIEKLKTECPTEWNPAEEEINFKVSELSGNRFTDTAGVHFDYNFGG